MAAWLAPALGLVGSLFGRKKKQKQVSVTRTDYDHMFAQAEKHGINKLTMLRNGSPGSSTSTEGPALASGRFIRDALMGASNIAAAYDPAARKREELENQLLEQELARGNEPRHYGPALEGGYGNNY